MQKLLLFSHNAFSNENANGITMKNLLSAWTAEEKAEFYCGSEAPDCSAAHDYFRVTDVQAIKSFFGKHVQHEFSFAEGDADPVKKKDVEHYKTAEKIPSWLKKFKYNFVLKWIRELCWLVGPWGHDAFWKWLDKISPDVLVYMVGESLFMDHLVLKVCKKTGKPLVLYNGEAYRIIDLSARHGLEKAYYRSAGKLYRKLSEKAAMILYNCETLQEAYEKKYVSDAETMVVYNSAELIAEPYVPKEECVVTYFGNLGVGRSAELLKVAKVLGKIDPTLNLHIYGNAMQEWKVKFSESPNIQYHGFVDAETLREVIAKSDVLLHVETFDEKIIPKLKYAFSTKIAQCLCAGRCFVSFAPQVMASSRYLQTVEGAFVVSDEKILEEVLRRIIKDPKVRMECADKMYQTGLRNHQKNHTAMRVRNAIEELNSGTKM